MSSFWYAIYTSPRSEKKVFERLQEKGIEAYLPLQKKLRQWKDRKKWIEVPVISSYIFVKVMPTDHLKVLEIAGVLRFIYFLGKAATIPEWQILSLKQLLGSEQEFELTTENIKKGDRVKVISGALIGMEGELVSIKGFKKVIVRLNHVGYSISVNIPSKDLLKLKNNEEIR